MALSRDECLGLLRSTRLGRIVFTHRALPAVVPVSYVLEDSRVIVRLPHGSPAQAARDAIVAFEADEVAQDTGNGWTVTVVGHAVEMPDSSDLSIALEMVSGSRVPCENTYAE